ncbi:MAG: DUF2782 domain-containing protein [bacterium]
MKFRSIILTCLFLLVPTLAQSQTDKGAAPPPPREPKPLAEKIRPADDFAPTVNITTKDDRIIEEYRVKGSIVMVRVTPKRGAPYYLVDTDGDGSLDSRTSDLDVVQPVMWKLFNW